MLEMAIRPIDRIEKFQEAVTWRPRSRDIIDFFNRKSCRVAL